jgi:hypothetical protein
LDLRDVDVSGGLLIGAEVFSARWYWSSSSVRFQRATMAMK